MLPRAFSSLLLVKTNQVSAHTGQFFMPWLLIFSSPSPHFGRLLDIGRHTAMRVSVLEQGFNEQTGRTPDEEFDDQPVADEAAADEATEAEQLDEEVESCLTSSRLKRRPQRTGNAIFGPPPSWRMCANALPETSKTHTALRWSASAGNYSRLRTALRWAWLLLKMPASRACWKAVRRP